MLQTGRNTKAPKRPTGWAYSMQQYTLQLCITECGFAVLDQSQNACFAPETSHQFSRVSNPSLTAEIRLKHKASLALK